MLFTITPIRKYGSRGSIVLIIVYLEEFSQVATLVYTRRSCESKSVHGSVYTPIHFLNKIRTYQETSTVKTMCTVNTWNIVTMTSTVENAANVCCESQFQSKNDIFQEKREDSMLTINRGQHCLNVILKLPENTIQCVKYIAKMGISTRRLNFFFILMQSSIYPPRS